MRIVKWQVNVKYWDVAGFHSNRFFPSKFYMIIVNSGHVNQNH